MPREAGPRTPPMSHLEANPEAGRERTEQRERGRREREENPQCSHLSPPVQLVMGGGLEQCLAMVKAKSQVFFISFSI